ncbi:MAG: hypothetical protein ACM3KR_09330 [Deltaproteobacteria bacterium]
MNIIINITDFIPLISEDVFRNEVSMCKNLNKKNSGGCNWGKCNECGVLPLLIKLHEGRLIEDSSEVNALKEKIFN